MSKQNRNFDLEEWLIDFAVRVIRTAKFLPKSRIEPLLDENDQLIPIFVTSIKTAQ
jgi:hypothetical protein